MLPVFRAAGCEIGLRSRSVQRVIPQALIGENDVFANADEPRILAPTREIEAGLACQRLIRNAVLLHCMSRAGGKALH
jgi:hypothetical protein